MTTKHVNNVAPPNCIPTIDLIWHNDVCMSNSGGLSYIFNHHSESEREGEKDFRYARDGRTGKVN